MEDTKDLLNTLTKRMERLNKEIKNNAPEIIIKNELRLIKDACDKLLEKFDKNSKKL